MPLLPVLELNARDSLKEEDIALPNIMVIHKHGLMTATQIETSLNKKTVEQVLIQPQQVLESNVKDLLKEEEEVLLNFNIMVILRLGLMIAILIEMLPLRPMEVLESMPLFQESVLSAKDSLKENLIALPNTTVILKLGSMIAILIEMLPLRPMEVLESMLQPLPVSVSSAKDLHKEVEEVLPNTTATLKLGLMIATQIEMLLPRPMVELESMPLFQESELSAKDLHRCNTEVILKRRPRVLLNIMEILRLGLMIAILTEMFQLRPTQVVLELMKLDKMDPSQE
jgi:hypothetical protein